MSKPKISNSLVSIAVDQTAADTIMLQFLRLKSVQGQYNTLRNAPVTP